MVLEKCDGICGDVDGKEEMWRLLTSRQRELHIPVLQRPLKCSSRDQAGL